MVMSVGLIVCADDGPAPPPTCTPPMTLPRSTLDHTSADFPSERRLIGDRLRRDQR